MGVVNPGNRFAHPRAEVLAPVGGLGGGLGAREAGWW
jgi:hypothetical protein